VVYQINTSAAEYRQANHRKIKFGGMLIRLTSSPIKDEQTEDAISCMYWSDIKKGLVAAISILNLEFNWIRR
jgi:hypothetical protein